MILLRCNMAFSVDVRGILAILDAEFSNSLF
jgi:hypothetical protein